MKSKITFNLKTICPFCERIHTRKDLNLGYISSGHEFQWDLQCPRCGSDYEVYGSFGSRKPLKKKKLF